jgi:hypothetical protein
LTLLDASGLDVPAEIRAADTLTQYAVEARYPGSPEQVTPQEHAEAVAHAEAVVGWAGRVLAAGGGRG